LQNRLFTTWLTVIGSKTAEELRRSSASVYALQTAI